MNGYDFDKTIYHKDSTTMFTFWCIRHFPRSWVHIPHVLYWGALMKKTGKERFKCELWRLWHACGDPVQLAVRFWDEEERHFHRWYLEHKKPDDLIISASPAFLVEEGCRRLGITQVIGSPLSPDTGVFSGKNCHGEEKVVQFRARYGELRLEEWYSDSLSDAPMARLAARAYLVSGEQVRVWCEN